MKLPIFATEGVTMRRHCGASSPRVDIAWQPRGFAFSREYVSRVDVGNPNPVTRFGKTAVSVLPCSVRAFRRPRTQKASRRDEHGESTSLRAEAVPVNIERRALTSPRRSADPARESKGRCFDSCCFGVEYECCFFRLQCVVHLQYSSKVLRECDQTLSYVGNNGPFRSWRVLTPHGDAGISGRISQAAFVWL
ncbi:hypothetical protein BV25DRAFT_957138 [Artomyces pyxidatus]|uniref:Uncharacterized protein n=1 Tax=Artomyces pyxidatus TaxID=48021 RepID=A0ACB8SW85_9AGAM|nr:hypothetical protein BV25DRAFT_957138 [Artomyces pyxidatus]